MIKKNVRPHGEEDRLGGQRTLSEAVGWVLGDGADNGLECLAPCLTGDIAAFRALERAGALYRMRTLQVSDWTQDVVD